MMSQGSNKNRPETPDNQFLLRESVSKNGSTPRGARKDYHEKQPLFDRPSTEPVKLTPAWEETNLPNDELNFKGVTMERADLEINPPIDRCKLVYLTLILHGIGTLMPWNMFITAKAYFEDYKLGKDYTGSGNEYRENFLTYLTFASQIPNIIFNWLNIFVQMGGNLTTRVVWSILIGVLLFIFTIILAMVDSSEWPGVFFWLTVITVVLLNMANGIYQNSVFGMAAKLPFKYTGAVVLGSNISGTFTSLINIITKVVTPELRTAAIYYFITALFVLLVCFDTYFALPLNRFFRYHELLSEKAQKRKDADVRQGKPHIPYWQIFKQCLPQLINIFLVFFVTLSLFPNILSEIVYDKSTPFFIDKGFFVDVTCFLTFNVFAMLGSLLATLWVWPSPKYLVIPVVLRFLFIPFFLVCNYKPDNRELTILIHENYVYWVGGILMAITSGYFSSVGMMYCPRSVEPHHAPTAGMFGAAVLITGIFCGILFTFALPYVVQINV